MPRGRKPFGRRNFPVVTPPLPPPRNAGHSSDSDNDSESSSTSSRESSPSPVRPQARFPSSSSSTSSSSSSSSSPVRRKLKKGPIPRDGIPPGKRYYMKKPTESDDERARQPFHIQLSSDASVRRRQCKTCGSIFATRDKLKRHSQAHTKNSESRCQYCDKEIRYSYNMRTHLINCCNRLLNLVQHANLDPYYKEFTTQCALAGQDLSVKLPSVSQYGYSLDKNGYVVGDDPNLEIDLETAMPGVNRFLGGKYRDPFSSFRFGRVEEEDELEDEDAAFESEVKALLAANKKNQKSNN